MTKKWTKTANGYTCVAEQAAPELKAALESNENFEKGKADDEQAPATIGFTVTIGEDLLKAYERRHHAELRGVDIVERLDRLHALIVTNNPEYVELVEAMFAGASAPADVKFVAAEESPESETS